MDVLVFIEARCNCEDYTQRFAIDPKVAQPCKHVIVVMKRVDLAELEFDEGFMPIARMPEGMQVDSPLGEENVRKPFQERVSAAIGKAISGLAGQAAFPF